MIQDKSLQAVVKIYEFTGNQEFPVAFILNKEFKSYIIDFKLVSNRSIHINLKFIRVWLKEDKDEDV